jgi:hippurate hydrolase
MSNDGASSGRSRQVLSAMTARSKVFASVRRDLHQHPETAFEENRTSTIVADHLSACGIEVARGIADTGIVGSLRAGSGERAIGLRADMDALPLTELNGFAHRSVHPGKMHACGHDGHVAILLAAAEQLAREPRFDGTVYFIFQPAEEGAGGASRMIAEGLFDRFPMDAVFGLHNNPDLPVGSFALKPGAMMAGADAFELTVEGEGGHAAAPHQTADPVIAAAAIIQAFQSIVSREISPSEGAVISVTRLQAGSSFNVIPDRVELAGTVRYFDRSVQQLIEHRMEMVAAGIAQAHRCTTRLNYRRLFPTTVNAPAETEVCREVLEDLVGAAQVVTNPIKLMASEDFAFMLEAKPGCYIWAGSGGDQGEARLHSPHYDFNDALLPLASAYWVRLVESALPIARSASSGEPAQGRPRVEAAL